MEESKVKIDDNGLLFIRRGTQLKEQFCPHTNLGSMHCGDWCPLFEEPNFPDREPGKILIQLCNTCLCCEKEHFSDERE